MSSDRERIIVEALRQTEIRLEDLQTLATAAENRSFQFGTGLMLFATLASAMIDKLPNPLAGWVGVFGLVLSAGLTFFFAKPRAFHVRGHFWKDWQGHVSDNDTFLSALTSQAEENDLRISYNEDELSRSASKFDLVFMIVVFFICLSGFGQLLAVH